MPSFPGVRAALASLGAAPSSIQQDAELRLDFGTRVALLKDVPA